MRIKSPFRIAYSVETIFTTYTPTVCCTWLVALISASALLAASPTANGVTYKFTNIVDTNQGTHFGFSVPTITNNGTPAGKALFQMLGVFSEFERAMIQERDRAGLERAKAEGKIFSLGRPKVRTSVERAVRRERAKSSLRRPTCPLGHLWASWDRRRSSPVNTLRAK